MRGRGRYSCLRGGSLLPTIGGAAGESATVESVRAVGKPLCAGRPSPEGGTDAQNPYRSPGAYGGPLPGYGQPEGVFAPTKIEMEDIFGRTWIIFKQQWGPCLLALIVVWAISGAFNMIFGFGLNLAAGLSRDDVVIAACNVASNLITTLFGIWLGIGQAIYFLRIARGQRAELGELFTGGPLFPPHPGFEHSGRLDLSRRIDPVHRAGHHLRPDVLAVLLFDSRPQSWSDRLAEHLQGHHERQ